MIIKGSVSLSTAKLSMQMHGIDIHLSRKRIKHIHLRIDLHGQVKISAPMACSLRSIARCVQEKKEWIILHQERLRSQPKPMVSQFLSGDPHLFLGKIYTLEIHEHALQQQIVLESDHLCCYFKAFACHEQKRSAIEQWHRTQMKSLIPDLLKKWEPIIGVKANQWGIKSMKTRWGSCNTTQKRIWLNLHLIHKPFSCLEYVLVHELVHLLEASHNERFHRLMSQFLPDWQVQKELLKKNDGFIC